MKSAKKFLCISPKKCILSQPFLKEVDHIIPSNNLPHSKPFRKNKSYKIAKNFFETSWNFKISNINICGLATTLVGLYAGPSLKFFLPVLTNFSASPVSFSAFIIFSYNHDEHFTWIKFRSWFFGRPKFHIWYVSGFTDESFRKIFIFNSIIAIVIYYP